MQPGTPAVPVARAGRPRRSCRHAGGVGGRRQRPAKLRLTAIAAIERQGTLSSVPVLLKVAADTDPEIAQAALSALTRLPGNEVDADILTRLPADRGKVARFSLPWPASAASTAPFPSLSATPRSGPGGAHRCRSGRGHPWQRSARGGPGWAAAGIPKREGAREIQTAILAISSRTGQTLSRPCSHSRTTMTARCGSFAAPAGFRRRAGCAGSGFRPQSRTRTRRCRSRRCAPFRLGPTIGRRTAVSRNHS